MSELKMHDSVMSRSNFDRQIRYEERRASNRSSLLTASPQNAVREVVTLDNWPKPKLRRGKRSSPPLSTALSGRIPKHPVLVPAEQVHQFPPKGR